MTVNVAPSTKSMGSCHMRLLQTRRTALLATLALIASFGISPAADTAKPVSAPSVDPAAPSAAEVQAISINPGKVALRGADDAMQLVVTATLKNGEARD